jgi:hypothetical protein
MLEVRNLSFALTLVLVALSGLPAGAAEYVAVVIDQADPWQCVVGKHSSNIERGTRLMGGSTVRPTNDAAQPTNDTAQPSLTVVLYTGEAKTFTSPTRLEERPSESRISRILELIMGSEHVDWASTITRGELDDPLIDGVVRLEGQRLELAEVMRDVPAGKLAVRLRTPGPGKPGGKSPLEASSYEWDPAAPQPLAAPGLLPGAYELTISRSDGKTPTSMAALVAVMLVDRFEQAQADYVEAVRLSETWPESVGPRQVRQFRRAALQAIGEPKAASHP